ncbi:hypothetical protein KAR26_01385 [Candidatus Parcubacteria bacterium]|nr:hypothetical protein [Candidatus Parcubacteria bacterium]
MEEIKKEQIKEKQQMNIMAFISYLGFFCLIPILTKEKDEFALFHAKQGLVLFICEAATWMVVAVIPFFFLFANFIGICWLILSLIGIVNVVKNQKQELPVIGQFADKFKI